MTWQVKSFNGPAFIAGVTPTLDYRFSNDRSETEAVSLTDKLTFSRSSTGTFYNSSNVIEAVGNDIPRFGQQYPRLVYTYTGASQPGGTFTNAAPGLLVEPSRANIIPSSVFTTPTVTGPDGKSSAKEFVSTGYGGYTINGIPHVAGTTYTVSCWMKAKPGVTYVDRVTFGSNLIGSLQQLQLHDTLNSFKEWFRAEFTFVSPSTVSTELHLGRGGGISTPGNAFYAWGAQFEIGSQATSHIPTTSGSVTRAAESASIDGTGVITGTYTMVEKPSGCAVVNGTNIDLVSGYTAERVMVFPAALTGPQITAIRAVM